MSPEPIVRATGLIKTYRGTSGNVEALRGVDAAFPAGEITSVVGSSGSGKSTLLRAIAGLDRPTGGDLHVAGTNLATATPRALRHHRRNSVTYVSQKAADNFVPHLTLRQHANDTAGRALELLAEVGLGHRLDSTPIELSGGEQARGAFALALAQGTPLVVIDEPTAELDRGSAGALLDAIRRLSEIGTAFIIATHDPDVTAIADSVLRLDRGRVIGADEQPRAARLGAPPVSGPRVPVLRAREVTKTFRRGRETIRAVSGATFDLDRGDLGVLLGRSGSGKSTLLALLAGWHEPDSGEIRLGDRAGGGKALDWDHLSYLPQRFGLMTELTIRENVELPARLTNRRAALASRVDHLLATLGLDELAGRRPHETSIGQQQRTALARALVLRPALLLADEPTSHQDAAWRDTVWRELVQAAAEGTTSLIATHEHEAAGNANRIWHIDEGVLGKEPES